VGELCELFTSEIYKYVKFPKYKRGSEIQFSFVLACFHTLECTDASFEVKETVLDHRVGNEIERAYQRSYLLDKRRALLAEWTDFLNRL
jgi:hypothetical protein